jgi:hypothetical protein
MEDVWHMLLHEITATLRASYSDWMRAAAIAIHSTVDLALGQDSPKLLNVAAWHLLND